MHPADAPAQPQCPTLLVVDDQPANIHALYAIFSADYRVVMATHGQQALVVCVCEKHDLILMDVVMPGLNGYQATRTLTREESTKHIPIIVCTSKGQETDKIWGLRQGAQDYLVKPVNGEELLSKIAAL